MRTRWNRSQYIVLLLCTALSACGNMDTMISTSSSYSVGALVNEQDLDDLAVIDSSGSIRPLFSSDAVKDPDAVAFRVSLFDSADKAVAEAVEYQVKGAAARTASDVAVNPIVVDSLSGELPTFSLPPELPVGRYSFSFEVHGEDGLLFQKKRPFYYVADKRFSFSALVSYPPGAGPNSSPPLFPTKVPLLLEASIDADSELDPFVVWSSGGKRIASGRYSEGKNRILWTTPENGGFHRIEATLYPMVPRDDEISALPGIVRTLTIATSPTAAYPGLAGKNTDFDSIFRFLGNLEDSGSAGYGPMLSPEGGNPVWLPYASGYGVSVGPYRSFEAARPAVGVLDGLPAASKIILSAAPFSQGLLYSATFKDAGATEKDLSVSLEVTSSGALLTVSSGEENQVVRVEDASLFDGEIRRFAIEFRPVFSDASTAVVLLLDDVPMGEAVVSGLNLSSSSGSFSIGGSAVEDEQASDTVVAVIDDLAVSLPAPSTSSEAAAPSDDEGAE